MFRKSSLIAILLVTVLLLHCSLQCNGQVFLKLRDAIVGRNRDDSGSAPAECDKGESYKLDDCNTCYCVGSGYRCTLKYCDESLGDLEAFKDP